LEKIVRIFVVIKLDTSILQDQKHKNFIISIFKGSITFFLVCFCFSSKCATRIVLINGAWSTSSTWSGNTVPVAGDSIVIPSGRTVTITTTVDYTSGPPTKVTIYGRLHFNTGRRLYMACDSKVYVYAGGQVTAENDNANSSKIEICSQTVWSSTEGPLIGPECKPANSPVCNAFLPIELIAFSAAVNGKVVDIAWTTSTEKNNDRFEIQRSSDALSFNILATVKSKANNGNSSINLNYQYRDNAPLEKISYYRLKQIDKNHDFTYSSIISVSNAVESNINFSVYPNPHHGIFMVDVAGLQSNKHVVVLLSDYHGKLMYKSKFISQEHGSSKFQIVPDTKLERGIYICSLIMDDTVLRLKVMVD
jgi:hypothetical protein